MPLEEVTETTEKPRKKKNLPPPLTPERAKIISKKGVWTKQKFAERRKLFKQAVLEKISPEKFAKSFEKALERGDKDAMITCVEAGKFVGLHFDQSEERVQNLNVKADSKVSGKLEVSVTGLDG